MYSGGVLSTGTGTSQRGSLTASALSNLDGTFNAGIDVTLVSLGSIASRTIGNADITADGQLSSTVTTTGGSIVARVTKTISSSNLTATAAAIDLATMQDLSATANATAGTTLTLWAGKDNAGTLTAAGNGSITSQTEGVTANATSNTADVSVSALKSVSGPITAKRNGEDIDASNSSADSRRASSASLLEGLSADDLGGLLEPPGLDWPATAS